MRAIYFPDANDIVVSTTIEGKRYKLRILWNPQGFWTFSIWDINKNPIIDNLKVVPNFPLTINKHCFAIPKGEFVVVAEETINRNSFRSGQAVLTYISSAEWNGETND